MEMFLEYVSNSVIIFQLSSQKDINYLLKNSKLYCHLFSTLLHKLSLKHYAERILDFVL